MARPSDPSALASAAAYAAIVARLAHRFADRAGVLEVRGLDEASFEQLERDALARLQRAAAAGDLGALAAFGSAVAEGRASLLQGLATGSDEAQGAPVTVGAHLRGGPPTVAWPERSRPVGDDEEASSSGPTQVTEPPDHEASVVDVLDLMETLHSKGPGTPPTSS